MFGVIGGLISSLISGVLTPVMAYFNKKQDVNLEEYKAASAEERDGYLAYVTALNASNQAKISANNWWGAHAMVYLFGLPAALHWTAVFWVNTFQMSWFGMHAIPAVPAAYANAELTIAMSFFILAPTLPVVTSVAQMLNRR